MSDIQRTEGRGERETEREREREGGREREIEKEARRVALSALALVSPRVIRCSCRNK